MFRKKISLSITISKITLGGIPTQANNVFVKIKQHRKSIKTSSEKIVNNQVMWHNEYKLEVRVPKEQPEHTRERDMLRFSFRLEDRTGKKFTRFGIAEIDIGRMHRNLDHTCESKLSNCKYNAVFTCHIDFEDEEEISISGSTSETRSYRSEISTSSEDYSKSHTKNLSIKQQQQVKVEKPKMNPSIASRISQERMTALSQEVDQVIKEVTAKR